MGDELLKKIIAFTLSVIFSSALVAAEKNKKFYDEFEDKIAQYDKLFNEISEKRTGVPNSKIDSIKNPFIVVYKKAIVNDGNGTEGTKNPTHVLNVTFNTKAKINGQWYKIGNEIGDFKLVSIKNDSVIIKNEHSKKELFIRKNDVSKIKFSSK